MRIATIHETICAREGRSIPRRLFFNLASCLCWDRCLLEEAFDKLGMAKPDWDNLPEDGMIGLALLIRCDRRESGEWTEALTSSLERTDWDLWYRFTNPSEAPGAPAHLFVFICDNPNDYTRLTDQIIQKAATACEGRSDAEIETQAFVLISDQISSAKPTARAISPTG